MLVESAVVVASSWVVDKIEVEVEYVRAVDVASIPE